MIASSICAGFGWRYIRRKEIPIHRRWMLTAAFFGLCFFLSYAVDTLLVGDTSFGGPAQYRAPYQIFLQIHVMLATIAGILGVITIWLAIKRRFSAHRRIAPWTIVLWFISAGTGLVVYLLLFVIFPPGPTVANLMHILTGR